MIFSGKIDIFNLENKGYQNLGSNLIYVNLEPKFFDLGKLAQNVKLLIYETQGSDIDACEYGSEHKKSTGFLSNCFLGVCKQSVQKFRQTRAQTLDS